MVGFFTQRPVFASAIAIIMVLAGAICYFLLPVSQFPDITPPQVVVQANYPGASAQVVADTVTTPLEQQINGVQGMTYMSSASSNDGSSNITITFDVGYPLSIAAVDVQNRVAQAAPSLPAIVNQGGVTIKKQNPNFVLIVNLTSPDRSVDPVALSNYAYLQIVDPLKRLPGVGDVQIFGERRYSMRVWLDPDKLAKLNITAVDVQNAVAEQNLQVAAGKIGQSPAPAGTPFEMQVNATGRLSDPEQFGAIVVRADPNSGAVVRLRDVARIELGALQYASSAYFGEDPTVVLAVYQMPGSNALDLQQNIKSKMDELSRRFPKGIAYAMHYDTTRFVSASMHDVLITLGEALVLVVAVVFVFLQSWRTTIIPMIAIPVSLVATLVIMEMFGFSLNMLSLLGMVLAIGLVVDDAIVVVENVERQLEAGLPPLAATRKAMAEVTGPIIATTAVLMAVFIPVAFIPGVAGRLYNQFALTVAISVGLSAFNSLTLSPALSAAFLRHRPVTSFKPFVWFNSGFDRLSHAYARLVRGLIRFRWAMLAVFVVGLAATYMVWTRIPSTFLPVEDQGYFFVVIQGPDGASLERTDAVAKKVRDVLQAEPGVEIVGSISGLNFLTNAAQSNSAVEFAILKPWDERPPEQNASKIVAGVRGKLLGIPEAFALSFDPPSIPGLGTTGGFEFQVEDLSGRGAVALNEATQAVIAEARKQPELNPQALFSSFSTSTPQFNYDLDRNKAKLLGLSLPDVFNTLQIYLGSLYVNDFNLFGHTFRVTLQADKDARAGAADISRLYVRNASGGMVPLSTLGTLKPIVGPETVPHYNNYGSALINGAPAPGFSSGQAVAAMQRAAAAALPEDFGFEWTGITFQELKAGSIATVIFALAIVFVFLILAAQYESWSMPFMVLLAVPLALFGALLALFVRGMQTDVYSQIGFVMLIGLAAKNAILIVEFAKRRREEGLSIVDAAMEAGRLRLRPILMTAFAFILGVVPLMIATGAGAASRQSIGTTVFGGMVAATVLTLLFVPVFYAVIENFRERNETEAEADQPHAEVHDFPGPWPKPQNKRKDGTIMRIGRDLFGALVVIGAGAAYYGYTHGGLTGVMALVSSHPAATAAAPPAMPAMPVPVARVVKRTIPLTLDYSARTESLRAITLQARISGYVESQPAADGSDVKTGDLLYRIDRRDYQTALDQTNAAIERDSASLDYQRSSYQRGDALAKSGYLAKDGFDQRNSTMHQAEAALTSDRAAARMAELNLAYTDIKAPFPGRLGRNQAPLGALIGAGSTVLNTLVQLDPIYVTFNPSETDLAQIAKAKAAGTVPADTTVPGATAGGIHRGEVTFIDNAVDRMTGTVTARATIANADFTLLPGQYVRVKVHVGDQPDALMVPQTAVGSGQLGKYVYVVGEGSKAEQKMVTLGSTDGDLVAVTGGVTPDDRIIVGNLQKIGPGSPVAPLPEKVASGS